MEQEILKVRKEKQEKIVEKIIDGSKLNIEYNLLLFFSAIITVSGILVNNIAIVIGGMLVTPLLAPILSIALGIASGDIKVINRSLINSTKSILIVISVSLLVAFFFSTKTTDNTIIVNCLDHHPLYLLVAIFSGVAAAFAYVSPKVSEALPGVAVAVSLMPPLAVFGIGIGQWRLLLIKGALVTLFLNFIGIVMGALIVFSLLKFYRVRKTVQKEIKKEEII